jgi:hypothetical protein
MAIHMPLDKMVTHLRSFKELHPLTTSCIYKIAVPMADYIGDTGCQISTRVLEHPRNTRLPRPNMALNLTEWKP